MKITENYRYLSITLIGINGIGRTKNIYSNGIGIGISEKSNYTDHYNLLSLIGIPIVIGVDSTYSRQRLYSTNFSGGFC